MDPLTRVAPGESEIARAILDGLKDGFRLFEIQFDDDGSASGAIVRDASAVVPRLEEQWLDRYRTVAQTGEALRFESWSDANQRWYEVNASRIGGAGSAFVVVVYADITERKREDRKHALLDEITQDLINPSFVSMNLGLVAEKIATTLNAKSCLLAELLPGSGSGSGSGFIAVHGWNRERKQLLRDTVRVEDFLDERNLGMPLSTRPVVMNDVADHTGPDGGRYATLGIRSLVIVPMPDDGRWRFQLTVVDARPRHWSPEEIALLHEIAQRIWTRVAIARAEDVLRHSEARQAFLLEMNDAVRALTDPYDIERVVARLLRRYLGVSGAMYTEVVGMDGQDEDVRPERLSDDSVPPLVSQALLIAAEHWNFLPDEDPFVVTDVAHDVRLSETDRAALEAAGVRAFIAGPVVKGGYIVGRCVVHQGIPRRWSWDEVAVVCDVAERTWAALGRARRESALREREDQLSRLNDKLEERVAKRTSQIRRLFSRLIDSQEDERRRFSRDIHDQLGQQMTAVRMHLEALRTKVDGDEALATDMARMERVAAELDESIDFLTWQLRPAALDELGLAAALQSLVSGWSERFNIAATLEVMGEEESKDTPDTELNLYRIVQEALHNVVRHANATAVTVRLRRDPDVTLLVIHDNGRGFDPRTGDAPRSNGLGLASMRERATLAGGRLEVESLAGSGTSIIVRLFKTASV